MNNSASRALASWSLLVVLAGCAAPPTGPVRGAAASGAPVAVARPAPEASAAHTSEVTAAEPAVSSGPEAAPDAPVSRDAGVGSDPAKVLEKGLASWYGRQFHGRRTASGERYDRHAMTAAHKTLPFGTRVRVRSVATGREVVVRINDRGPFKRSRVIDLSQAAFNALGLQGRGVTQVELLPE